MAGNKVSFPFKDKNGQQFIFADNTIYGPFEGEIDYSLYFADNSFLFFIENIDGKSFIPSTAMAECKAYIIFDKWAKDGKAFSYYLGGLHYVQIGNNSYIGDINCDGEIIYLKDGEVKFDY